MIGLLATMLLAGPMQDTEEVKGISLHLPADTEFLLRTADMRQVVKKLKEPPYKEIMEAEFVREALQSLLGDLPVDLMTLVGYARGEVVLAMPRIDGDGFMAVFDTGLPVNPYTSVVTRLFGKDWKRETEEIGGVSAVKMTGPTTLYFASVRRYFVVATGRNGLEETLSRMKKRSKKESLGREAHYVAAIKKVGDSDLHGFLNWKAAAKRVRLLRLLPVEWMAAGADLEPTGVRFYFVATDGEEELSNFFGKPAGFDLPAGSHWDVQSVTVIRPRWDKVWSMLESDHGDPRLGLAWIRFRESAGVETSQALLSGFQPELTVVRTDDAVLGWVGTKQVDPMRRTIKSVSESMSDGLRFFVDRPRNSWYADEHIVRVAGTGFCASRRGFLAGSLPLLRRAIDEDPGTPDWLEEIRGEIPDSFVALQVQTGRAWKHRFDLEGLSALLPDPAGLELRAPELVEAWLERLSAFAGLGEFIGTSVTSVHLAEGGLEGRTSLRWKAPKSLK